LSIPAFLAAATDLLAQVTTPTTGPTSRPARPGWADLLTSPLIPVAAVMLLFVVMSSRSRKKQEQKKQGMLDAMKRGDRIQTIGGILGNIVEVRDDRILVKIDEGNNTKVWFARSAIHRVLGDEAEAK
jgi:preprotein translocase subunit YajC